MTEKPTTPQLELVGKAMSDDPFDLSKLRIDPTNIEGANVKKILTTLPVKRPGNQDFIKVRSEPSYRETMAFIELKEDREVYIVNLTKLPELRGECFLATLFTAITRTGVLFMWPVKIPAADGRVNAWHQSGVEAAQRAMTRWIRIKANMSLGAYEIFEATSKIPEPIWPDLSFDELCRIAFKDRLIDKADHAVVRRLLGR